MHTIYKRGRYHCWDSQFNTSSSLLTMSLPSQTTVLIVGAGPTGLATALSLLQQGIQDICIVDAVKQGENSSRAMAIHAGTLEVYPITPEIQVGVLIRQYRRLMKYHVHSCSLTKALRCLQHTFLTVRRARFS
jgi:cation diffusion facilitator CzcD-associated flavoprotein CzcO